MYHDNLSEYTFRDIEDALQKNDDVINTALILQLTEINLLRSVEEEKRETDRIVLDDEDGVDDLLDPSSEMDPEKKKRSTKDLKQENAKHAEREQMLSKIQEILEGIKNRPQEFLGADIADKINGRIGFKLIPDTKEIRSAISTKILVRLANSKAKNLGLSDQVSRSDATARIKQYRKDHTVSLQN